jgi:glutathione S-transferase
VAQRLRVIGNYLSPFVRKVLVYLELKQVEYEIDPIVPFVGNEEFSRHSPLRRVPVLLDGALVLNDSSVICQYLEDRYPTPALYPRDIGERAQARWLEEYADTHLARSLLGRMVYPLTTSRYFHEPTDEAIVRQAREVEIPAALDYLETRMPDDDFLFGALSIADISIASCFRTAAFVRYPIDAARWPLTAALVDRVQALPVFTRLARLEECQLLRVPEADQRAALVSAGAPLSSDTLGTGSPRRGVPRGW